MTKRSTSIAKTNEFASHSDLLAERLGHFVVGNGAPVVMLHSSLASKSQWTVLADRLASRFRVIALDLLGYGDNPASSTAAPFALDEEIRLVTAQLDHLVEPHLRVHLVGHSYGGLVALRFAQRMRGRVASLALYEPVVFRMLDDGDPALTDIRRLAEQVVHLVAAGRRDDAAKMFVDFWGGAGSHASLPPEIQDAMARRIGKVPLDFQAAWLWPAGAADLRSIVVPTLLLSGKHSPAVVRHIAASLADALPNVRGAVLDCGHMGPVTNADLVNPWIEAFVDLASRVDASGSGSHGVVTPTLWRAAAD